MIFTKGSVKAVLNDKVIEDSTWNLESLDDKEFQMKLNRNGKKYDIRNFTLDDLGTILQNPHTIDDIDDNDFDNDGVINEADKYSYNPKRASGIDYDGDGTDDEFDSDDDNDGFDDIDDAYPNNSLRASGNDSDGDGIDNEFDSDKTIHAYFSEITDLSNNWYQAWWGIFYIPKSGNWVFHSHLGWLYALPSAQDTFWLHDEDLGWLYSTKTLDRFFYRNSTGGWLYQLDSTSGNRFWDYQANSETQ